MAAIRTLPGGVRFHLRLTPKGGRDGIDGWGEAGDGAPHLKARVRAAPEDGKANAALIALLAKTLGVSRSAVSIAAGHAARLKTVEVSGDTTALCERLESLGRKERVT